MSNNKLLHYFPWALIIIVAIIFVQSLPFKFSAHQETQIIFMTIGNWMNSIGLPQAIGNGFGQYGGYIIGSLELVTVILLFIPKTRLWGALLGVALMTGAIFFHLFTPLGVIRVIDEAGNTDNGVLFTMACIAWISNSILAYINRSKAS